jgi:membrane protein implicated in regulation of membrane protease activity
MEGVFWGCFIGGAVFALVSTLLGVFIGSLIDGVFDLVSIDFFKPIISASAITTFGGSGILLSRYTGLGNTIIIIFSILIALLLSVVVYFIYVKPMENSENSIGFSEMDLPGKLGEVTIPIAATGFGEIMIKQVAGNTLHIASSWDKREIPVGREVVVVDIKDGVTLVSELYNNNNNEETI